MKRHHPAFLRNDAFIFCHGLPTNGDFRRHSNLLFFTICTFFSVISNFLGALHRLRTLGVLRFLGMSECIVRQFYKTTNAHYFTRIIIYSFLFVGRRCRRKHTFSFKQEKEGFLLQKTKFNLNTSSRYKRSRLNRKHSVLRHR